MTEMSNLCYLRKPQLRSFFAFSPYLWSGGNEKRINEIEINCFTAYSYSVHKGPNDDDVDWSADLCTPIVRIYPF